MKKTLTLILVLSSIIQGYAQGLYKDLKTDKGYMIYMRPEWVFQPCADSSTDLLNAINYTSFIPGTFSYSFGMNLLPLEGFGSSMFLKYRNNLENKIYQDTVYYFYCKLKTEPALDSTMDHKMSQCRYTLYSKDTTIGLNCTFYSNAIYSVEPISVKDRITYLRYLKENNYQLPEWSNDSSFLKMYKNKYPL